MNFKVAFYLAGVLLVGLLSTDSCDAQTRAGHNPLRRHSQPPRANQPVAAAQPISYTKAVANTADYVTPMPEGEVIVEGVVDDCGGCGHPSCGHCQRGCLALWGSLEYLMWWEKGGRVPPLVTSSVAGTDRDDAGVLGEPGTIVLFGGDAQNHNVLSGARLTIGSWFEPGARTGVAVRAFAIEDHDIEFATNSDRRAILARPFFNAFTDEADALLLGFPNEISGDINLSIASETEGLQAFFRRRYKSGCNYRIDVVGGYRYLRLREALGINNSLEFIDPDSNNFGVQLEQDDLFDVENEFHGGEIGLMGNSIDGRWTLDFLATVAFGETRRSAAVSGRSVATSANGDETLLVGGLLTQGTNIGQYEDNPFAVVPEATITLGYFVTPRLDLSLGYTFLYVSKLTRPGRIVDTAVNLTQQTGNLDGPARPEFLFKDSDYWLQGINLGLNLRY